MQGVLQRTQRQLPALLGFQSLLERNDSAGLVPEAHLAALLVLDQMGGQSTWLSERHGRNSTTSWR